MTRQITLYTRKECCLCEEMKGIVQKVAEGLPLEIEEIDVDKSTELRDKYGDEVPVLFIDGRKAFKYRVAEKELKKRLQRHSSI